jgi:hypothetical protein
VRVLIAKKKPISLRAYARSRGISHTAVQRAVRERRLLQSLTFDDRGIAKISDPALADQEWNEFTRTRPLQQRPPASTNVLSGRESSELPSTQEQTDYQKARATREYYEAQLKRLKYQTAVGELLCAEDVEKRAFNHARQVRDTLLSIPDRLAPLLAAEGNTFEIHRILTDEMRRVCNCLANYAGANS